MLERVKKDSLKKEVPELLSKYLQLRSDSFHIQENPNIQPKADMILDDGKHQFIIEFKNSSGTPQLLSYWHHRTEMDHIRPRSKAIHLLMVPYMGETGRRFCEEKNISWLDLSGNARIQAKHFFIHIEGKQNRFKEAGRPSDMFAPKSSRITRQLLMNPLKKWTQREMSRQTGLDEGFTSRVVRKLLTERMISKDDEGKIIVPDPGRLLDARHDSYDFSKHVIIKGHIAAQSSQVLTARISDMLRHHQMDHAATGLTAAWQYDHFTSYRITSFYVAHRPEESFLNVLYFREDERGANTWLIVPNDEGVFQGCRQIDGLTCVHPLQVYLDLKGHPERSQDAAQNLKTRFLNWSRPTNAG